MKKRFSLSFVLAAFVIVVASIVLPTTSASAAMKDGSYQIHYEIKEASNNNTSIADGYFSKPATLTIDNGTKTIQLKVTSAEMIKSLSTPNGPVTIVSDSGDTRTVKFNVSGDLSEPLTLKMHVIVPEEALPGGYDMEHTARAIFDVSDIPEQSASTATKSKDTQSNNDTTNNNDTVENPPTGDHSPLIVYGLLVMVSVGGIFLARKLRTARD